MFVTTRSFSNRSVCHPRWVKWAWHVTLVSANMLIVHKVSPLLQSPSLSGQVHQIAITILSYVLTTLWAAASAVGPFPSLHSLSIPCSLFYFTILCPSVAHLLLLVSWWHAT
jgi:hypothetical protein